jgi:serine/threonine-protein kinase
MEFVDGPSCSDLLRDHKRLEIEDTVAIVRDACHGLDYAHRAGVVHRDVKPGNLLVANETGATKLADFGIAKAAEQTRITQVGSVLGTAAYLSPEQARGEEAGPASDIYSLGVCAYQFLAGRLPHEYSSLTELALKQQQDSVAPIADWRPEVPPQLDRAVRLCLERAPESRYASALDLAAALEAGLRGEDTAATRAMSLEDDDLDATRALERTQATRAIRRPLSPSPPRTVAPEPVAAAPLARADERPARRYGPFLALLAVLAAIAAVGLALLASSDDGGGVEAINRDEAQQQIQELRDFIRENTAGQ